MARSTRRAGKQKEKKTGPALVSRRRSLMVRQKLKAQDEDSPNKGQSDPERPAGNKLRTQAEDTAKMRARETQKCPQDTS